MKTPPEFTETEKKLEKARADLAAWEARNFGGDFDHGEINIPGRLGSIDRMLEQYNRLNDRVHHLEMKVSAERVRAGAPARAEAKARAHREADLRAEYGHCTEVRTVGGWLPVRRWNAKSVTVESGVNYSLREIHGAR